eukprot:c12974_g1_i1.p1 GENE.c12974_g1_i1~~c12974_g1_i1.p1  ORF type:complete len:214 (-),score=48.10 c12974_g1_i1:744-1385(-)
MNLQLLVIFVDICSDKALTVRQFATTFVNDHAYPIIFVDRITESVQQQIDNFHDLRPQLKEAGLFESTTIINLSIRIGDILLKDQFLWDVLSPHVCPETFAESLVKDLDIPSAFAPLIAFHIHEQALEHTRVTATAIQKSRSSKREINLGPQVFGDEVVRDAVDAEAWGPVIVPLISEQEKEKVDQSLDREHRLKKRQAESTNSVIPRKSQRF